MWNYYEPTNVIFGIGEAKRISEHMEALGVNRALLVADKFMTQCKAAQDLQEASNGKIIAISDDVDPNPTIQNVDAVSQKACEVLADCVIALGGGSSIDCSKAVSVAVAQGLHGADLLNGAEIYKSIPLIAIPTTAGTGSEVTKSAVLSDPAHSRKSAVFSPRMFPRLAIIDPVYTYTMPPKVTAATGLDVLAHAIDSMSTLQSSHVTEALAMKACMLAVRSLERAITDGGDKEARADMAQASSIAGLAFSQTGTAGSHACSYVLTEKYHMPHGEACAFTLDDWIVINAKARPYLCDYYRSLGFDTAEAFASWINHMKQIGGLRARLGEVGVAEDGIAELAKTANENHNMANNVAKIGYDGIYELFAHKL